MRKIDNPRFPHYVTVYREVVDTNQIDQVMTKEILLESECRQYVKDRAYTRGDVVLSNYIMALPFHNVRIVAGDKVFVRTRERELYGIVVDSLVGNLGANIWYNEVKQ